MYIMFIAGIKIIKKNIVSQISKMKVQKPPAPSTSGNAI